MTHRLMSPSATLISTMVALLALVCLTLSGWLLYDWFNAHERAIVWDLFSPWLALRRMLLDGVNPYDLTVVYETQLANYGRVARPDEDQRAFSYPMSIVAVMGPLAVLPLPLAQALWLLALEVSVLLFLFVAPRAVGWHPPLWLWALTLLCSCALYQNIWAFILGQISIVIALCIALAWWGLHYEHWILAGICMALATIKPQMTFLIVPGMLLWALWHRHLRVVASFGISLALLLVLPLAWVPDWPLHWLTRLQRYADYTFFAPPVQLFTGTSWGSWILSSILVLWPIGVWWRMRQLLPAGRSYVPAWGGDFPMRDWLFSWLIAVTAMTAPRTSQANQLFLLLPLFFCFAQLSGRSGRIAVAAVEIGLVIVVWLVAAFLLPATNHPEYTLWEHQWISPILPVGVTAALVILSLWRLWPRRGTTT